MIAALGFDGNGDPKSLVPLTAPYAGGDDEFVGFYLANISGNGVANILIDIKVDNIDYDLPGIYNGIISS